MLARACIGGENPIYLIANSGATQASTRTGTDTGSGDKKYEHTHRYNCRSVDIEYTPAFTTR